MTGPDKWVFTFSAGHLHPTTFEPLRDRYVHVTGDHDQARAEMIARFGNQWAEQTPAEDADLTGLEEIALKLAPRDRWGHLTADQQETRRARINAALTTTALTVVLIMAWIAPRELMIGCAVVVALFTVSIATMPVVAVAQTRLDQRADRAGLPIPDPEEDLLFTGAISAGAPLGRRTIREYARTLALSSPAVRAAATVKSMRRNQKKREHR